MSQNYICVRAQARVKVGTYETGDFCETGVSPNSRKLEGGAGRGVEGKACYIAGRGKKSPRGSLSLRRSCCPDARAQNQGNERKEEINKILKRQSGGPPGKPLL